MDLDDIDAALADLTEDQLKELDEEMDPEVRGKKENARDRKFDRFSLRARARLPQAPTRARSPALVDDERADGRVRSHSPARFHDRRGEIVDGGSRLHTVREANARQGL